MRDKIASYTSSTGIEGIRTESSTRSKSQRYMLWEELRHSKPMADNQQSGVSNGLPGTLKMVHTESSVAKADKKGRVVETDTPKNLVGVDNIQNTQTALQRHVSFWDPDNDDIIWPRDVYNGFRDLGFSVPFAVLGLLINFFFSYPTRLGYSYIPDPLFRIRVDSIHKAKHGSDTSIYDSEGELRSDMFEKLFAQFDRDKMGGLSLDDLSRLTARNRVAADPAGWTFALMEWSTTWLLLQRDGRVYKEDLRQCYDGTLFWRIRNERRSGEGWKKGYGWIGFFQDALALIQAIFDKIMLLILR